MQLIRSVHPDLNAVNFGQNLSYRKIKTNSVNVCINTDRMLNQCLAFTVKPNVNITNVKQ